MANQMGFMDSGFDRGHELRSDAAALAALWPLADVLPLWRGQILFNPEGLGFVASDHPILKEAKEPIFMGMREGKALFAADISDWRPEEGVPSDPNGGQGHPLLASDHAFADLRHRMAELPLQEGEIAATARAMCEWHRGHGYCASCGSKTEMGGGGWHRKCPSCKAQHFPRTDPCVIMRVTREDKLLLGRSPGWPEGMYSLLAGFIEPCETIEAGVRREVLEETGVLCGDVRYIASQPWPFPASLMLGCHTQALSQEIKIDPVELDAAQWVSRAEVAEIIAGRHQSIKAPRKGSIARFLMVEWVEADAT